MNNDDDYVREIEFVALSSEEIRAMSVVDVAETMLYERGLPRMNSVLDMRMGSTDRRYVCGTCKHSVPQCPGHSGKIELASPVYNPVFLEITLRVLRCVCFYCSSVLDQNLKIPSSRHRVRRRLASISQVCRSVLEMLRMWGLSAGVYSVWARVEKRVYCIKDCN